MKKIILMLMMCTYLIFGQQSDSVDVTFYYYPETNVATVYLPGEFNGWSLNSSSSMTKDSETGFWHKTYRLRVGGPSPLPAQVSIPGAYQYKFNVDGNWIPDPFNPRQNQQDNNNSYIFLKDPTIYLLLPNSTTAAGILRNRYPEISAFIYPSTSSPLDLSSISIKIDDTEYNNISDSFNSENQKITFTPSSPLGDGEHTVILSVRNQAGNLSADTTTFTIQAGVVQLLTLNAETWKTSWRLQGAIFDGAGGFDTTITSANILRQDSIWSVKVADGKVDTTFNLLEGDNLFSLEASIDGQIKTSEPINIIHKVNHTPEAIITNTLNGNSITFSGLASTDPEEQELTYLWSEYEENPEQIGIAFSNEAELSVTAPATPGEYYYTLYVTDTDLNVDSTKSFFVVEEESSEVKIAQYEDNPGWVKNGRIYTLFFKSFTPTGTINAAIPNLPYIKAMGFNIIWVLPVMEVLGNIDNQINIGYYTNDFLSVESSYGSDQDFKDFVQAAHDLGLKVILDVTPNHTGKDHAFAKEASAFGEYSQYLSYYQTESISHNTNGLGECRTAGGLYYYCAFSDVLLNYNWNDIDARKYMIDVYKYWVEEFDIDGYRFDVYWGPHRKYGEDNMGIPVRRALKKIKPDIFLLGEDDGVGPGTEVLYADRGGGLDASYDFRLYFDGIRQFNFSAIGSAINNLHSKLDNDGFHPGENSQYLRFMESQDEERISYRYNSFEKTMPVASSVFLAPGLPMLYNGQEVGWGIGMGAPGEPDLNDRRRGIIDWDFDGRELLTPHYQKLAQIRAQFSAFSRHRMDTNNDGSVTNQDESDFIRVTTGNSLVYSYLRPYKNSNGLTVVNFGTQSQEVTLDLTETNLIFDEEFSPSSPYWINDLYNGSSSLVSGSDLSSISVSLPPYGTAIYTISSQEEMVNIPELPNIVSVNNSKETIPRDYSLNQNYPNPFNPSTTISFKIPVQSSNVFGITKLIVYDVLGRKVKELVNAVLTPGNYNIIFNANNFTSGIYFYSLSSGDFHQTKKMILLK